jgi:hypothetical protein
MFSTILGIAVRGSVSAAECGVMVMPGWVPERMVVGQRLMLEDIQISVRQVAGVEHVDQVLGDEMAAARDVDDRAAQPDFSQCPGVQDAARMRGERQQADHGRRFFSSTASSSVSQVTPGSFFGRRLQPATLKPSAPSLRATSLPSSPRPS